MKKLVNRPKYLLMILSMLTRRRGIWILILMKVKPLLKIDKTKTKALTFPLIFLPSHRPYINILSLYEILTQFMSFALI